MARRLGATAQSYTRPLTDFLAGPSHLAGPVELIWDEPLPLALRLREEDVDAALLSPIDYGRDHSAYRLVSGISAHSSGRSNAVSLLFTRQSRTINTIAAELTRTSDMVLATLILKEKFHTTPGFIPIQSDPETMLGRADAVLLAGDQALRFSDHSNVLDLIDEWDDLTGLPFVHAVWAAREGILSFEELGWLKSARDEGVKSLATASPAFSAFGYSLDEKALAGLTEFFRLSFYHGILKDIPELDFHPES